MQSRITRLVVALAVVVALVGAVGLVSADMNATPADSDERENGHMGGLADHIDGDMIEMMQDHMSDHDHGEDHDHGDHHDGDGDHHDGDGNHC